MTDQPAAVSVDEINSRVYEVLLGLYSLLNVCEQEWRTENAWTEYDQSIMDAGRALMADAANKKLAQPPAPSLNVREAFEKWWIENNHTDPEVGSGAEQAWTAWSAAWSQRVQDGWVAVPVEPTTERLKAMFDCGPDAPWIEVYKAAIAPYVQGDNNGQ